MKKSKSATGILENLYLDTFEKEKFTSFTGLDIEQATQEIIDQYQDLIKDFPPDKLEEEGQLPDALWQGLKKIGIFGLNVPKQHGGVGLPLSQYLKVLEHLARTDMALAIIPTAHLSIGLKGIILFGNEEQKKKYLTKAAGGEMIFAYALTEPGAGSDAQHIETAAALSDDGRYYILNGTKTYITNGGYAGGLMVFAQMDPDRPGYMGAFIVETAWDGVTVGKPMPKMGLTISSTTSITLKDVKVPKENLIGQPGDGFKIAMTILNYGRLGLGGASIGVMKQAAADMIKRAATRKQFGVPIKNFELIQEKIVKARVYGFAVEAMTHFTAHLLQENPCANVAIESSHTKLFGTTSAWDTLYDAMQTAGGAGYLASLPYEKRMRDFRVATIFEGTTEIHSIYPPVHLLRILGKMIKKLDGSKLRQFFFVLTGIMKRPKLHMDFDDHTRLEAAAFIKHATRTIRNLLFKGFARYGLKLLQMEFYLRRITRLSLAVYGLIGMLAVIEDRLEKGQDVAEEMHLLGYFLEEKQHDYKTGQYISTSRLEKLHRQIMKSL